MKKITLEVQKRDIFGRKVKKLRDQGILPANIYGKKVKSQAISVSLKDFKKVYDEAGETSIVYLNLGTQTEKPVLVHHVQADSVNDSFLHVDFHQVDLKEKVTAKIPVEVMGKAPAENQGLVLMTLLNEIEVEALPQDLPDKFSVDVSKLEAVNQSVTLKDLKFDREKVKPLVEDENALIVKISEPTKEVVEEKPVTEEVPAVEGEEGAEAKPSEEAKTTTPQDKKPEATAKPETAKPEKSKESARKTPKN